MDLATGFKTLNTSIRVNRVKTDHIRQRFHERPGLKRKRLKSERWRRSFKTGFQEMVGKIKDMRKKGW